MLAGRLEWGQFQPPDTLRTSGGAATWEHDHVRPDGNKVPILVGAAPVSRSPFRAVCFALDLTQRNRALERVKRLHALASALAAALSADDVAAAILTHGMRATGASSAVLGFVERGELVLSHRHRFGDAVGAPPRRSLEAGAPMPEAVRTGEAVLLDSREAWLERFPGVPPSGDFEAFDPRRRARHGLHGPRLPRRAALRERRRRAAAGHRAPGRAGIGALRAVRAPLARRAHAAAGAAARRAPRDPGPADRHGL